MKYNVEIKNNGPLPIPFVERVGDQIQVRQLYKDKPLYRDALFIGATILGQFLVHSTHSDTILEPSPELEIAFKSDAGEVA